jgi:hypothetical protein
MEKLPPQRLLLTNARIMSISYYSKVYFCVNSSSNEKS